MGMDTQYQASAIEVLSGLAPVQRRPGMYTDTSRPNHLAQEVIDNSVDEALAGFATRIDVILHADNSITVSDNGRGMPVDLHPDEGISGVELILTRLHAGAKFSQKNYQFSGGLHGVGVSVVNALSKQLITKIKRDGKIYEIVFENGEKKSDLTVIGKTRSAKETGTTVTFQPDPKYFDSPTFSVLKLMQILRAKAVLCSGLEITLLDENTHETHRWYYENGLIAYLQRQLFERIYLPEIPFEGHFEGEHETADWALVWLEEPLDLVNESYVNLIPTPQGGTHVNGLRAGLLEAFREFCDYRNLLPRGVKLAPDDVWSGCAYVLSVKLPDPQFAGQTKERLSSRECAAFVSGVVRDALSLWLNQHVDLGEKIADWIIARAQKRLKADRQVIRKKVGSGPALPGKLADCTLQDVKRTELFLVEGDSAGGSAKQARDKTFQAIMPLRGKILNTWEIESNAVLGSQEIHDIAVAIGVDPGSDDIKNLRYGKICILADADSDGAHIATLLCALFVKHFKALVSTGHIYIAMPPLYRIDIGNEVFYALNDDEKNARLEIINAEKKRGKISIQRFKGLGEMNPLQLRETTMNPDTRRLVQLTLDQPEETAQLLDMLLAKKRSSDRKSWLETKGDLAVV
jgi:topoisomerase-4 subunit B